MPTVRVRASSVQLFMVSAKMNSFHALRKTSVPAAAKPLAPHLMGHVVPGALLKYDLPDLVRVIGPERVTLAEGQTLITRRVARLTTTGPFTARASADLVWRGERIPLTAARQARPSIPHWWIIGPFNNPGGERNDIRHPLETHPIDLEKTYLGPQRRVLRWRTVARDPASDLGTENLVDLIQLYGQTNNVAAYALVWLDAAHATDAVLALGSDDGVVVWLNGRRVHTNLVPRPYRSKADRVALRLHRGRNPLLLKITQGMGDWSFCAHLEDPQGRPLRGVDTSLDEPPRPPTTP